MDPLWGHFCVQLPVQLFMRYTRAVLPDMRMTANAASLTIPQRPDLATRCSGTPWSASGPTRETSDEGQNLLLLTQPREAEDRRGLTGIDMVQLQEMHYDPYVLASVPMDWYPSADPRSEAR